MAWDAIQKAFSSGRGEKPGQLDRSGQHIESGRGMLRHVEYGPCFELAQESAAPGALLRVDAAFHAEVEPTKAK